MKEARINAWMALGGLLASIALWFLIDVGISESATFAGNSPMLTSRFFPRFATIVLAVSSLSCLLGSLLRLRNSRHGIADAAEENSDMPAMPEPDHAPEDKTLASEARVLALLGLFLLYGLLFHRLGYLYSSMVVSTLTLLLLGCRNWKYYLISWAFGGLIFLVFTRLLYVPLP